MCAVFVSVLLFSGPPYRPSGRSEIETCWVVQARNLETNRYRQGRQLLLGPWCQVFPSHFGVPPFEEREVCAIIGSSKQTGRSCEVCLLKTLRLYLFIQVGWRVWSIESCWAQRACSWSAPEVPKNWGATLCDIVCPSHSSWLWKLAVRTWTGFSSPKFTFSIFLPFQNQIALKKKPTNEEEYQPNSAYDEWDNLWTDLLLLISRLF